MWSPELPLQRGREAASAEHPACPRQVPKVTLIAPWRCFSILSAGSLTRNQAGIPGDFLATIAMMPLSRHEEEESMSTHRKNRDCWEVGAEFTPGRWHWEQDLSPRGEVREMMRRGKEFKLTYSHSRIWELSKNFWWTNSSFCHWWMKALNLHWGSPDMVLKQCRLRKINRTWTKKWRGHSGY